MVALSAERSTIARAGDTFLYGVKASTLIYKGALVAVESATGFLLPMNAATGLVAIGRAVETIDNSSGADAELFCRVEQGVFRWVNDGTNPIDATHIGTPCYAEDDQTVSTDSTGKSIAGLVVDVDAEGVWVKTEFGSA